jgi:pilus assembly protein CpaB
MKVARLVVLGIAGMAGLAAAYLSIPTPPPPQPEQPAQVQTDTIDILVAKADIGIGDRISPQNIQWKAWPVAAANDQYVRKAEGGGGIEQVTGAVVRTPFVVGEPINQAKLIKADGAGYIAAMLPSGMRAMQIEISPETAAVGFILPKDRVDIILTRTDRSPLGGEEYSSETLLTNIPVLAIDQNIEEKNGQRVVPGKFATVELTLRQAETVALARRLGTLSLVLRSLAESNQRSAIDEASRRDVIRIVRFGTTTRF